MKSYLTFSSLVLLSCVAEAQAYEGTVQFDKKKQPAIVIEYAYPSQAVENAFILRMGKLGYKPKEEKGIFNRDKGVLVFRNAYVTDITEKRLDYIIKVERKSRKEDDESVMYVIVQESDENALQRMESGDLGRLKTYLNEMIPDIEAANLELQIEAQQDVIAKAEKKLRDLEDEYKDLTKKLDNNVKSQEDTHDDIDAQKKKLEILEAKRKKND